MKYHSLFLSEIRKDVTKFVSPAVVIGPLRVKTKIRHDTLRRITRTHLAPSTQVS